MRFPAMSLSGLKIPPLKHARKTMAGKLKHFVIFQPSGRRGFIETGKTIKQASRELGVNIEGVCADIGSCGKCMVIIKDGIFNQGVEFKRAHLTPINDLEKKFIDGGMEKRGYRLACQARIRGDVAIFVPEESRGGKQVIRKEAGDRAISLNPAVKKYHVELTAPTLEEPLGDWERLSEKLAQKYRLTNLTIDYKVLPDLPYVLRRGNWKVTVSVWMNQEIVHIESGLSEEAYGLAIDIGTTTVAGYLCEMNSGKLIATEAILNPQVIYGEDVMSRITYGMANRDGLKLMNKAIIRGINEIAKNAATKAKIRRRDILDMAVVGNTCMHHLFLNIDPQYMGRSPFAPAIHHSVNIKARELGLKIFPGAYVHMLPVEAGFVGADNIGVLIAEEPYLRDEMALIIDIGTNGELVLGNRHRLLSSSCATGPAFEGAHIKHGMRAAPGAIERIKIDKDTKEVSFKVIGNEFWSDQSDEVKARGICGSGIIDAIAEMFKAGIIQQNGRLNMDLDSPRLRRSDKVGEFIIAWVDQTSIGQDIVICQEDIRAVQLAKGALYAGAKIMMRRLGVDKVDKVALAGAFGNYINKESAASIGLFPDCAPRKIQAVGNAAGDGARIALLNVDKRAEADKIARQIEYVELTLEPEFERFFCEAMWFPHMMDNFPHLSSFRKKTIK